MGILGLFRLNGAFLLLPSILSLLVVMTVILDHSIIIFLRVGGIFFFFHFCLVFTWSLKYCKEGITAMKISSRFYYRFEKNPFIPSILTVCLVPFFNALTDQPLSDWSLPVVYSILTSFQYAEFLKQKNSESDGINVFEKQDRSKRKCAIT